MAASSTSLRVVTLIMALFSILTYMQEIGTIRKIVGVGNYSPLAQPPPDAEKEEVTVLSSSNHHENHRSLKQVPTASHAEAELPKLVAEKIKLEVAKAAASEKAKAEAKIAKLEAEKHELEMEVAKAKLEADMVTAFADHVAADTTPQTKPTMGWVRPDVIYGHIHMAKTAGTEINGDLAMQYERVCGHKGYSFDAYQANLRFHQSKVPNKDETTNVGDSISKLWKQNNRNRVPFKLQMERSFEDCDYISLEEPWKSWNPMLYWTRMEMHLPCRDPLSHLMSMCSHVGRADEFNCNSTHLAEEVKLCTPRLYSSRWNPKLLKHPNATVKCFNPMPPQKYGCGLHGHHSATQANSSQICAPRHKQAKRQEQGVHLEAESRIQRQACQHFEEKLLLLSSLR